MALSSANSAEHKDAGILGEAGVIGGTRYDQGSG
jgi:hypothetical protein